MARLENWHITSDNDPYKAPELLPIKLCGEVYNHPNPRIDDGRIVTTSSIQSVKGLIVKTRNTTYHLGKINSDYKKWCEANNGDFDEKNPIKVII